MLPGKRILHIDHMVCDRCKYAVRGILSNLGWRIESLELGRVTAIPPAGEDHRDLLKTQLETMGFALHEDTDPVARIKGLIIEHVYDDNSEAGRPLADLITVDLGLSYPHLSRKFSAREGRTITDYYRVQRMERARRLLATTNQPISRIAARLNYGSAGRFAAAFRRATGQSPTEFRDIGEYHPRPLDEL